MYTFQYSEEFYHYSKSMQCTMARNEKKNHSFIAQYGRYDSFRLYIMFFDTLTTAIRFY